jgi:hypothetical protein
VRESDQFDSLYKLLLAEFLKFASKLRYGCLTAYISAVRQNLKIPPTTICRDCQIDYFLSPNRSPEVCVEWAFRAATFKVQRSCAQLLSMRYSFILDLLVLVFILNISFSQVISVSQLLEWLQPIQVQRYWRCHGVTRSIAWHFVTIWLFHTCLGFIKCDTTFRSTQDNCYLIYSS